MSTIASAMSPLAAQLSSWFVWGASSAIQAVNKLVVELASTNIPFLLVGESGTGKDAYARVIHVQAGRNGGTFKKIVCAGLTPQELSHELDQHTGPDDSENRARTLYLDEVEMLSAECQRHLLTYLSEEGANGAAQNPGARLICATTSELQGEVEQGRFRRELYFRLNGAYLHLPALRERSGDIELLTEHFLVRHARELNKPAPALKHETTELLMTYHWPGNIRELENAIRKTVALGDANVALNDLRVARIMSPGRTILGKTSSLKLAARAASRQTERELILRALERTKWNRKRAAQELQISYKSLLYKLKQIETPGNKNEE